MIIHQDELILISPDVALAKHTANETVKIQLGGNDSSITAEVIGSNGKTNISLIKLLLILI